MVGLILVTLFAVVGIGAALYSRHNDGPIEEQSEVLIEDTLEEELNLPDGSLKGKIDLTPGSPEK